MQFLQHWFPNVFENGKPPETSERFKYYLFILVVLGVYVISCLSARVRSAFFTRLRGLMLVGIALLFLASNLCSWSYSRIVGSFMEPYAGALYEDAKNFALWSMRTWHIRGDKVLSLLAFGGVAAYIWNYLLNNIIIRVFHFNNRFKAGDYIKIEGTEWKVLHIGLYNVSLHQDGSDGSDITSIIPYSVLAVKEVIKISHGKYTILGINVSMTLKSLSDEVAKEIIVDESEKMLEAIREMLNKYEGIATEKLPSVYITAIKDTLCVEGYIEVFFPKMDEGHMGKKKGDILRKIGKIKTPLNITAK